MGENGSPKELPTLRVIWSQEHQDVGLEYDPQEFRRWEFIRMVLLAALDKAENALKAWRMHQMAQQQRAEMEQAIVQQQLQAALHQGQTKILKG